MMVTQYSAAGSQGSAPLGDGVSSRIYAILFADAAHYSKMSHSDEVSASRAINDSLKLICNQVSKFGGRTLNLYGDGVLAAFDSAVMGTRCAIEIQNRIEGSHRTKKSTNFGFRIGMNIGEVIEIEGNAFGDSINIAARIEQQAETGTVLMSASLYEAIRSRSEFGFVYMGPFALKNINEPVDLYRVYDGSAAVTLRPINREQLMDRGVKGSIATVNEKKPSIAVLPFKNASANAEQQFFVDGVTEDIIRNLTRFKALSVIASGSSFAFRGSQMPLAELGAELGARYIVRGNIRQAGDRIRVSVELDDTRSQLAVWSERYDGSPEDIFAIQDEITELAVSAMAVRVETAEKERFKAQPPKSLDAYGLVLRGQAKMAEFTSRANAEALELYLRAHALAPDYARALSGISRNHSLKWRYGWGKDAVESLDIATRYAIDAVAADPNDARGHSELGFVQLYRREHDRAIASYERALSLNPNDANIIAEMADVLTHSGRPQEALALFEKAMRLNPMYPDQYLWDKAGALMLLHRFEEAIALINQMVNPAQGRRILAACYAHLGDVEAAKREAEIIRAEHPGFSVDDWVKVIPEKTVEGVELFASGLKLAEL